MGPLPWKVMGHILRSWDNDFWAHHKSEGLQRVIVHFKGSQVRISKLRCSGSSVPEDCFYTPGIYAGGYNKTGLKQPLKNRQNKDLNDKW